MNKYKIAMQLFGGLVLVLLALWIVNKISGLFDDSAIKDYGRNIDKHNLTYSEDFYSQLAGSLKTAMEGWGTDEQTIYRTLQYLQTYDDWLMTVVKYGTDNKDMTLPQRLIDELDDDELLQVNIILAPLGVQL